MKRRLFATLTAAVALVVGLGAGGAYAYWSSEGSGRGTAGVGTPAGVTVVAATGTPSSKLIPGTSADLVVQLDNPNSYSVTITGVSQNGSVTPVGGTGPGTACSSANSGVSVPTQTGLGLTVASGTGVVVHVPNGALMGSASASGCQGASFQIPVTVTVQR
ncbi:MAG: hypothetical protein ABR511_01350 [Acidimicrobiales bacterium]